MKDYKESAVENSQDWGTVNRAEWSKAIELVNKDTIETVETKEAVDHPSHYNSGQYEVIDVIDDWQLNFELGNAVKYIARAGKKDESKTIEDLEKAIWYIQREIKNAKKREERNKKPMRVFGGDYHVL